MRKFMHVIIIAYYIKVSIRKGKIAPHVMNQDERQLRKEKTCASEMLWYFPPIPRFQRMYSTKQIAKDLTWHICEREVDGFLYYSANSPSWKLVDFQIIQESSIGHFCR